MELKFLTVKERDCMGVILMFWQGYLLQFLKEHRCLLRANKKVGFEGPLGLFEKLPDIFHYYYGYLDYR